MRDERRSAPGEGGEATSVGEGGDGAEVGSRQATLAVNRRDFLLLGVAASAAAVGCDEASDRGPAGSDPSVVGTARQQAVIIPNDLPVDFTYKAVRRDDFVTLKFDFINMGPNLLHTALNRINPGPAFVIVQYPSQHVFEETVPETAVVLPTDPIESRLSDASRVAFVIPDDIQSIVFTLDGLLALVARLELHVSRNALPRGARSSDSGPADVPPALEPLVRRRGSIVGWILRLQRAQLARAYWPGWNPNPVEPVVTVNAGEPEPPWNHETSLELPYRLVLSPHAGAAFTHASRPVSGESGRVELWHSRLGLRNPDGTVDESESPDKTVRAIWTRDPGFMDVLDGTALADSNPDKDRILTTFEKEPLNANVRKQIVQLTSDFATFNTPTDPYPRTIDTKLLMLSSMGGYLDVRGDFEDPPIGSLVEWEQRIAQGRDNYIKVVERGYLFPFGHRAQRITIVERKFMGNTEAEKHVAFLRKRTFIRVLEPVRGYSSGRLDPDPDAPKLRRFPFEAVIAKTVTTPNLDLDASDAFLPSIDGAPFLFQWEAVDVEANLLRFKAAASWVKQVTNAYPGINGAHLTLAKTAYGGPREVDMAGQRIAYAESIKPDDTTFETKAVRLGFEDAAHADYPDFFPIFTDMDLAVEAVRHLAKKSDIVKKYSFYSEYLSGAFGSSANPAEIVLTLAEANPVSVDYGVQSDRSGGLVNPSFELRGLSRRIGPVSADAPLTAASQIATGNFKPSEFFGAFDDVKLFGLFKLTEILPDGVLKQIPKYVTQILTKAMHVVSDVEKLAEDLRALGYSAAAQPIPQIDQLLLHLPDAFAGVPTAVAAIPGDVTAVVNGLASVPSNLAGLTVTPLAYKDALLAKAQALVSALPSIQADLLEQVALLASGAEFPKEVKTHLEWRGRVKEFAGGLFTPNHPESGTNEAESLLLRVDIAASAEGGGSASIDTRCSIEDFSINLFGTGDGHFLTLDFKKIEVKMLSGKKPDVSVDFGGIEFGGPLKFIENIKKLIPMQGFSDPPYVTADANGITSGFTLALPAIAVGVFSLENIVLGAELRLPFVSAAPLTFSFNFSTRENPFNLTVALLGGGGFFGLTVSPRGILVLEAALEAGARISLHLGVASGSVSAALGIYFRMQTIQDTATESHQEILLTGYFRVRGQLDVLGLITISAQLALELTYNVTEKKVIGRATLEVEIDILFFSVSVTVTCERRFAGSNGDPTFLDIMRPELGFSPWNDYLAAYA